METKTIKVPAINCDHCTRQIKEEVGEIDGVSAVTADVNTKEVTISWQPPADWNAIDAMLNEIGFPAG